MTSTHTYAAEVIDQIERFALELSLAGLKSGQVLAQRPPRPVPSPNNRKFTAQKIELNQKQLSASR